MDVRKTWIFADICSNDIRMQAACEGLADFVFQIFSGTHGPETLVESGRKMW